MQTKYVAPLRDYSGYGEAGRHDVAALNSVGVEITAEVPRYCLEVSEYGTLSQLVDDIDGQKIDYDVVILHVTPNVYRRYYEPGKYHVGRAFWETDKVPYDFFKGLNMVDEIWTGSEYNAKAMKSAGVVKPIHIIPEAIDDTFDVSKVKPFMLPDKNDKVFRFYSIFEWTERKNPNALLSAYWQEFAGDKNVTLTIKTFLDNFEFDKHEQVYKHIERLKRQLNIHKAPPVDIVTSLMSRQQIYRFHKTFDCFVSAHRGEGWGIPQMEALYAGNVVISTNCGGIHEHLEDGKDAELVQWEYTKVKHNNRNRQWYTPDQNWAEVDIESLKKRMRFVYKSHKKKYVKEMRKQGRKTVIKKFGLKAVGKQMLDRLREIHKEL